tara:strand:+ start:17646 stop:18542 length:897 start_codon:yes stop_codon:yes gene_type:complete
MQKEYNQKIYGEKSLTPDQVEKHTQELALCAHAEISSLVSATKYKKHHISQPEHDPDKGTILYESVDIVRYVMAILNLWNFDEQNFEEAFKRKDVYLNVRKKIERNIWNGQPVAIVDMDDVIVDFRKGFSKWLCETHDVDADVESNEYYFIDALREKNLNPELTFLDFVNSGGFSMLDPVEGAVSFLKSLKSKGYWIQILTARPDDNLHCLYDTYYWLDKNNVYFDDIAFSAEKFRWCAQSKYYDSDSIKFSIDDSPKHAMDYVKHGIKCYVPEKSYNKEIWNDDRIEAYKSFDYFFK